MILGKEGGGEKGPLSLIDLHGMEDKHRRVKNQKQHRHLALRLSAAAHRDGPFACGGLVLQDKRSGQFFTGHNLKYKTQKQVNKDAAEDECNTAASEPRGEHPKQPGRVNIRVGLH